MSDSSIVPIAIMSIVFLKVVDAILLFGSVEDRAAVHWCVVVTDVEEGAARVELLPVVEREDAWEFKLVFPVRTKFRVAKLRQAESCNWYASRLCCPTQSFFVLPGR